MITDHLKSLGACQEALDWADASNFMTLQEAWDACERGDWLML